MSTAPLQGGSASNVATGSMTQTLVETEMAQVDTRQPQLTLYLRERPGVTWSEDTIDNEGLGRKSSKKMLHFP